MKRRDHSKEWLALLMALLLMLCCFSGLAEADATLRTAGNLLENAEINRLIDENYQQVLENGYAELRIPLYLHGMTEDVFTENARDVASRLLENGYKAFVIGGCIRDFIMGKESNDIDFVTDATLEQQRAIFGDAFQTHISSGNIYGGLHDIREGILKTMADAKVVLPENPLIVLRTLRFQAR